MLRREHMRHRIDHLNERQLMAELIRELSEFNKHIRSGHGHKKASNIGHFVYAFNPSVKHDSDIYHRHISLINTIHDVLSECRINIRSKGYAYIKDAICLITDHNSLDINLDKEVYSLIAEKHRLRGTNGIEHSIRYAISSAFRRRDEKNHPSIMDHFRKKPSNKEFLLHATQEVNGRAWNEICT